MAAIVNAQIPATDRQPGRLIVQTVYVPFHFVRFRSCSSGDPVSRASRHPGHLYICLVSA